ncbi:Fe-S cluster assembly protein SufD, partial [Micromonospora sp. WMMD1120]|nr:Fe-S cluster assembly protein SufD [Micromonospora sp. WMMD1120]
MTTQASAPPPSTKSQALRSYDVADFPALTGLEEDWRFTPLKRLRGLTGVPAATGAVRHEHDD